MSAIQEADVKAVEQDRYHEDKSVRIVLLAMLSMGLTVGIVGLVMILRTSALPPPVYFASSMNGALFPEKPLDQPSLEINELLNWVTEAMMASNTFNFIDFESVMNAANLYYTKEGFESYKNALSNAKIPDTVVEKKFVLKATAMDAPQLLLEKPFAGRYMWKIKIPMQFRYQNVTTDFNNFFDITLIVMRVPTIQSANGVLILKYDLVAKAAAG